MAPPAERVSTGGPGGGGHRPGEDDRPRCSWASGPWLTPYHDEEWGVPVHDDRRHFELLVLESAQAGLSWLTILKRREGYRRAFADFDPARVARFSAAKVERLLQDPGIIRNRAKVTSTVSNARAFLDIQSSFGTFDAYVWDQVGGSTVRNRWRREADLPAATALSESVSRDLRRRGFRFLGPTASYAYLQAAGLVLDHVTRCFRYAELAGPPERRARAPQSS
jgi:DNA-3-methyladenine glycosylase I